MSAWLPKDGGSGGYCFLGGLAGGLYGVVDSNGLDGVSSSYYDVGTGGGGGGASKLGNGGNGGNGGNWGAGGGGGGSSTNGFTSGAGGNGAGGCIVVTTLCGK